MSEQDSPDYPLNAAVECDQLVIRIGLNTLAHAAEHCPLFYHEEKHMGAIGPYCKVTDKTELAADVIRALFREKEDGSSRISDLLDEAFEWAADDGSIAFTEDSFV